MTIDIPLPDLAAVPAWGWAAAGTVAWYLGVCLVYRFSGYGPRLRDRWTQKSAEVAKVREQLLKESYNKKIIGGEVLARDGTWKKLPEEPDDPTLKLFGLLLVSPLEYLVLYPVTAVVWVLTAGPVALATGKAAPDAPKEKSA